MANIDNIFWLKELDVYDKVTFDKKYIAVIVSPFMDISDVMNISDNQMGYGSKGYIGIKIFDKDNGDCGEEFFYVYSSGLSVSDPNLVLLSPIEELVTIKDVTDYYQDKIKGLIIPSSSSSVEEDEILKDKMISDVEIIPDLD